jgi:hypothetical protein
MPERCDLHEAVTTVGTSEPEAFLRWASSPLGDECQRCSVCRWARTFIARRLAERAGRAPAGGDSAEDAWRQLQVALAELRASIHRSA